MYIKYQDGIQIKNRDFIYGKKFKLLKKDVFFLKFYFKIRTVSAYIFFLIFKLCICESDITL